MRVSYNGFLCQPSKLKMGVRFPLPAHLKTAPEMALFFYLTFITEVLKYKHNQIWDCFDFEKLRILLVARPLLGLIPNNPYQRLRCNQLMIKSNRSLGIKSPPFFK